jgi:hypothetical protein
LCVGIDVCDVDTGRAELCGEDGHGVLSILSVRRQIYQETNLLTFSLNNICFVYPTYLTADSFSNRFTTPQRAAITHITLDTTIWQASLDVDCDDLPTVCGHFFEMLSLLPALRMVHVLVIARYTTKAQMVAVKDRFGDALSRGARSGVYSVLVAEVW